MRDPKTGEYFLPEEYRNLPDNYGYAEGGLVSWDHLAAPDASNWDLLALTD
jgi:hypothetical protein